MQRWIMHIDMDAFFASIEQHDHPELRGQPLIVGGGDRGVVSAASYEVRKFGVHSAMPTAVAKRLCPHAIFVPPRMARYMEVSRQVRACLDQFSPLVEMASVDEAYIDATGMDKLFGPVTTMAEHIQATVAAATDGLSCAVGIAPVKFLAKISSDMRKPGGIFLLTPEEMPAFLATLPLGKIPGVGKKFLAALEKIGVRQGADVLRYDATFWQRRFGKQGEALYARAQGLDNREVTPSTPPKSESAETTFAHDTTDREFLKTWLLRHAERIGRSLRKHDLAGRVITLKIKYEDFQQCTRQMALPARTNNTQTIFEAGCHLLDELFHEKRRSFTQKIRLIGLKVSAFDPEKPRQLNLLNLLDSTTTHSPNLEERRHKLDTALDQLRDKYGNSAVLRGRVFSAIAKKEE